MMGYTNKTCGDAIKNPQVTSNIRDIERVLLKREREQTPPRYTLKPAYVYKAVYFVLRIKKTSKMIDPACTAFLAHTGCLVTLASISRAACVR